MNHVYRLVFNRALGVFQVASELGRTQSKGGGRTRVDKRRKVRHALSPIATAMALALGIGGLALPASALAVTGTAGGAGGMPAAGTGAASTGTYADNGGAGGTSSSPNGTAGQGANSSGGGAGTGSGGHRVAGAGGTGGYGGGVGGAGGSGSGGGGAGGNLKTDGYGGGGGGGYYYSPASGGGGGGGPAKTFTGTNTIGTGTTYTGGNGGGNLYNGVGDGVRYGGGGGGGGAGAILGSNFTLTNSGTIQGGKGGDGNGGNFTGSGGGGGGGGLLIQTNSVLNNNHTISGGNGGNGGNAVWRGGNGGGGGAGIAASAGVTINNSGSISGGAGGAGGGAGVSVSGAPGGTGGGGGTGIVANGGGVTIINSGSISGGAGGAGGTGNIAGTAGAQGDAIDLSGGGNTLELLSGSTISGNVVSTSGTTNGGDTLELGGSKAGTFAIGTVGTGQQYQGFSTLKKTGSATWTITGANSSGLGWHLDGGTLSVSSVNGLGSYTVTFNGGTLQTSAALTLNQAFKLTGNGTFNNGGNNDTLSGVISGSGAMTFTGSGTTILNGTNTYTGATTVSAGTLEVGDASHTGASITSNVTVNSAGTLRGHGTITGDVTNGGTVYPGGSIGVLTVSGNYTQNSSGTLNIEVTPNVSAGAGVGYDQLNVTGTATLAGALAVQVDSGTYTVGSKYDIVHAGTLTGTFSTVSYNPAFASYLTPKVSYTGTDAYLSLIATPSASNGLGPAFTTAQGVAVGGFATVNVLFDTQNALLNVQGGTAGGILKVNGRPDPGVWVRGLRGFGSAYGAALSDHAVLVGGGSEVRPGLILGGAVANTQTRTQSSQQKVDTHTTGLSGYGLYNRGPLVLGASVSAGRIDTSSYRTLQPTGLDASGSAGGWYAGLAAKAGWRLHRGIGFLVPSLSAAYLHTRRDAYSESGAGSLNLTYGAATYDIGALRAGVRTGIDWRPRAALTVSPWLGLGAVAYMGNRDQGLPVTLGTTQESLPATAAPDKAALVDAGLALMSRTNWSAQFVYHGQFSDHTHMNTADLKVVYRW